MSGPDLSGLRRAGTVQRWVLEVTGRVQGVGCRDFVRDLALRLRLTGYVWNDEADPDRVGIVVQGPEALLRSFTHDLAGTHGLIVVTGVKRISIEEPSPSLLTFTRVSTFPRGSLR